MSSLRPCEKRLKDLLHDDEVCIFCEGGFTKDNSAVTPNPKKFSKLFEACKQRQDRIGMLLLENRLTIESSRSLQFRWHATCRAQYASPEHIARYVKSLKASTCPIVDPQPECSNTLVSRSLAITFEWKKNCFICGKVCSAKLRTTWSLVASNVHNKQKMYANLLKAAEIKKDSVMITTGCA